MSSLLKNIPSFVHRWWWEMVLVIICWFNVDYCFLSVYYDGRVYSIILMLCEAIGSVYYIIFVSRRLNISCIKFKIRSFYITTRLSQLFIFFFGLCLAPNVVCVSWVQPRLMLWGTRCSFCPLIIRLHVLGSVLWCPLQLSHTYGVRFVVTPSCLYEGPCFIHIICVCLLYVQSSVKSIRKCKKIPI